jgi:hypothetical protein
MATLNMNLDQHIRLSELNPFNKDKNNTKYKK